MTTSTSTIPASSWLRLALLAGLLALLAGCATTISNKVTTFHEFPQDVNEPTYVFEPTPEQANDLEYRNYENLLRAELARVGFEEVDKAANARFKVKLQYSYTVRDVRVIQPVAEPYPYPWGGWGPGLGLCRGPQGYYPPGIYYPGCGAPPIIYPQESRYQMYARQLRILMADARTGRNVYDVTVNNDDTYGPLPEVIRYMMRAAFQEFPGPSGVARVVELKMDKRPTPQP